MVVDGRNSSGAHWGRILFKGRPVPIVWIDHDVLGVLFFGRNVPGEILIVDKQEG
jgi:hypothetical protein